MTGEASRNGREPTDATSRGDRPRFHLAVEGWRPTFDAPAIPDDAMPAADTPGQIDVETPADDWAPRTPAAEQADDVVFVDGVRRIDARIWASDDSDARLALAVSYAAGAVRCNGTAVIEACEVRRGLFGPVGLPELAGRGACWRPSAVQGGEPQDLLNDVHTRMFELERDVARRYEGGPLLVVDGPLRRPIAAIGYVKTHKLAYLPPAVSHVVSELAPGQRTPVFLLQSGGGFNRFSWYLRLPYGSGGPWAGVVRCEAPADLALPELFRLADTAAATLPSFASQPHKDPRAPQNLYPIAGLERRLTHHLGDAAYLERTLRELVAATRS